MFAQFLVVLALVALVAVQGAVEHMTFAELESDTSMKLVLFHDPAVEESNQVHSVFEEISNMSEFNSMYLFKVCDVSKDENKSARDAGLTGGALFTHTPEAGIDGFGGTLSAESFRAFHTFRTNDVEGDNVHSLTSLEDVFNLAQTKPVFLKLYEQWCGHCKKMKKHFQYASAQDGNTVHYVEVECSAAGNTCAQFGVQGYPTVRLLAKTGDAEYKVFSYEGARTHGALLEFGKNALEVANAGKFEDYTGIVPDGIVAPTNDASDL
jgi:thiol-disulfide isomerase/thioredoxin